jgi:hypothetical protein
VQQNKVRKIPTMNSQQEEAKQASKAMHVLMTQQQQLN